MKKNSAIKLFLFCFGLFLLFALIYRAGFSEIIRVVAGAKLYLAFSGVLVYLMVIFIRSYKWFLLIKIIQGGISYRRFVPLFLINSLIGNLTPFKFGEAATPVLFKKYLKIPLGRGFSVIVLDRFFELVVFNIILVSAVFYILNQGIQNNLALSVFRVMFIAVFLLLAVFITVIISKKITMGMLRFFRILRFAEKELDGFYDAVSLFKNKRIYYLIIPLTIMGWFFEFLSFYLIFNAVFSVSFINIAAAQSITAAATFVSFIPGGIGVGEVGMVYILGLMGYPFILTASGAVLASLFLNAVLFIAGLAGFISVKKKECSA